MVNEKSKKPIAYVVMMTSAVALDERRYPSRVLANAPNVEIIEPMRMGPNCTISIGFAPRSVVEETDAPVVVLTAFGQAKGGEA